MTQVVEKHPALDLERMAGRVVARYFSVQCREAGSSYVCKLTAKNVWHPMAQPSDVAVRIPASEIENHGYVNAMFERGFRDLMRLINR